MAMGLANLLRPEPFKCKRKGDSEQLMQDFVQYRGKMELFFTAAQVVGEHTGAQAGRSDAAHTACNSCKQEKAMVVMLGGEEMNKLFEHVGGVAEDDSYIRAMDKVEQGIKRLTNQATARFKLFQEMPQDGRGFREWSQLVVEQANRCDWTNYDRSMAARDAILFQMEDKKLRRKVIAEDPALTEVIKLGIANEQAVRVADRFRTKPVKEAPQDSSFRRASSSTVQAGGYGRKEAKKMHNLYQAYSRGGQMQGSHRNLPCMQEGGSLQGLPGLHQVRQGKVGRECGEE